MGDAGISLHGEGGRVILTREGGDREEVDLEATGRRAHPGESDELPPPAVPPVAEPPVTEPPAVETDVDKEEGDGL